MPMATVMVKDFWLPNGKKRWVAKTDSGVMYGIPEALSSQIRKGGSYDFAYKEDKWNGRTYLVVEGIFPPTGRVEFADVKPQAAAESSDDKRSEDIATLALCKMQQVQAGDRASLFHALKASALAWRDFKKWQKSGNIETSPRREEEFPE